MSKYSKINVFNLLDILQQVYVLTSFPVKLNLGNFLLISIIINIFLYYYSLLFNILLISSSDIFGPEEWLSWLNIDKDELNWLTKFTYHIIIKNFFITIMIHILFYIIYVLSEILLVENIS